ncbi:hypothetical protein LX73_0522 [Fodinibius salinus]|uniref:DinB superfamily protein n=1 Tax=Fodinibius salinus TaxID=860790 RepID=A0A5D3YM51_9BACT|nr:hypothetical protein [Fodinibius salinus]TYP95226.1 hypothetical protein LX73_0522 [Fodinibius salinus]
MTDHNVTQDDLNNLIEDVTYLQDEAEAMQYVIDSVPYDKSPPEGRSIAEMLLIIDHAQISYYRPLIEEAVDSNDPVNLDNVTHFRDSFEYNEDEDLDIQKVLRKLAKHRAGLANTIDNIPLIDWETVVYRNNQEVTLFNFVREMIRFERTTLNDIADQIMVLKKDQQHKREIQNRREQRENQHHPQNS